MKEKTKVRRFHQRDLSWLAFNHRVLQEAKSPQVPLLERLKFLAIFSNNLDEFFRVRVSALRSFKALAKEERRVELKPKRTLKKITKVVNAQQNEFGQIFQDQIIPSLRKEGINLIASDSFTDQDRVAAGDFFEEKVKSRIDAVCIDLTQDSTYFLNNRDLYLVVALEEEEKIGLIDFRVTQLIGFWC